MKNWKKLCCYADEVIYMASAKKVEHSITMQELRNIVLISTSSALALALVFETLAMMQLGIALTIMFGILAGVLGVLGLDCFVRIVYVLAMLYHTMIKYKVDISYDDIEDLHERNLALYSE